MRSTTAFLEALGVDPKTVRDPLTVTPRGGEWIVRWHGLKIISNAEMVDALDQSYKEEQ